MDGFDRGIIVFLFSILMLTSIFVLDKVEKLDKQLNPQKVECIK